MTLFAKEDHALFAHLWRDVVCLPGRIRRVADEQDAFLAIFHGRGVLEKMSASDVELLRSNVLFVMISLIPADKLVPRSTQTIWRTH
jgi:hypothetical protein